MAQQLMIKFEKDPTREGADILPIMQDRSRWTSAAERRAWPKEEIQTLIQGIREHGKVWPKITPLIPKKNIDQIRSMATSLKMKF